MVYSLARYIPNQPSKLRPKVISNYYILVQISKAFLLDAMLSFALLDVQIAEFCSAAVIAAVCLKRAYPIHKRNKAKQVLELGHIK